MQTLSFLLSAETYARLERIAAECSMTINEVAAFYFENGVLPTPKDREDPE